MNKIRINEIFSSMQGGSLFSGVICTFIRFTGCNIKCSYCDTSYAREVGDFWTIDEILKKVKECDNKVVVITGGEPLLQDKEARSLSNILLDEDYTVLLETNGTFSLKPWQGPDNNLFNVIKIMDIKCPFSGHESDLKNIEYLAGDEIRFVIKDKVDYDYAKKILKEYEVLISKESISVLFSPVWGDDQFRNNLAQWILNDKLKGVRYQLELHKLLDIK